MRYEAVGKDAAHGIRRSPSRVKPQPLRSADVENAPCVTQRSHTPLWRILWHAVDAGAGIPKAAKEDPNSRDLARSRTPSIAALYTRLTSLTASLLRFCSFTAAQQ